MFFLKTQHFNKRSIINGLVLSILLSSFIYLDYFNISFKLLDTFLALASIFLLLKYSKSDLFFTGFFVGIFWFWWFINSLQYYDLNYLAPFIILGLGIFYGLSFLLLGLFKNIYLKAILISLFLFYAPFGFDWLKLDLIFINSYLNSSKLSFILVLIGFLIFFENRLKSFRVIAIFPFILALSFSQNFLKNENQNTTLDENDFPKIYMSQFYINQDLRWQKENFKKINSLVLDEIYKAIDEKYDVIVLPETIFTFVLSDYKSLFEELKILSNDIDIIAGSIYKENNSYYNASYFFSKENVQIAKKVVLVPFGEEIPLPKFMQDFINKLFYGGASDLTKANFPTDFLVKDTKFRNAICYEGTNDKIYEDLNGVENMIMISNNAWFTPSIEPTLQHLLLKYYSSKYDINIYHIVNGSKNRVYKK
ncbi:apolipoprotein N-acyltransferase [Aliarcobacter thereius]|uniref:Apolipoprotein N-acyltransferase n=1 Tax=Aliarcobacter thereius TaxID=544718 RepID=A0A5R9H9C5_9BACT|nr:apolipoprotein N-acyltransferase [Aliarcobacter thereius]TLS73114.1 apolipoprotein N-acyltransferase [Aliarcobacter thereius]